MGKVDLIYKIYLERLIISKNKIEMAFSHKGWTRTDKSNSFLCFKLLPSRQDDKNYWLIRLLASAPSLKKNICIELKKLKIYINVRFSYLLKIRAKRN